MTAGRGEPGKGGRRGCPAGREGATWRRSLREWQQSDQQRGWSGEARLWQPLCAARQPCEPAPLGNSCARPARPPLRRSPPRTGYFWSAWARQNLNRGSAAGLQRAWLRRSEKASQPAQEHLTVHLPLAEGSGVRLPARPPAEQPRPCPELAALLPHGHASIHPSHSLRGRHGLPPSYERSRQASWATKLALGFLSFPPAIQGCIRSESCRACSNLSLCTRTVGMCDQAQLA